MKPSPEIVVVPHTHWDREWYLPFQRFRAGLVRMLDDVLASLASDPDYRFTMDGQLAAIEDYLEVRPHRRDDVARFVREGRLAAGPWMILADEFLCSGETLIRNLEYGLRGAYELGGAKEGISLARIVCRRRALPGRLFVNEHPVRDFQLRTPLMYQEGILTCAWR